MSTPQLTIIPLQSPHQAAARRLILDYLTERWGNLDPALNADLENLMDSYAGALFVTAWLKEDLVGTGALVYEEAGTARIVRMVVAKPWRGQGIGKQILQYLCQQAQVKGYQRIVLETEAAWEDAISFYTRCGFHALGVWNGEAHFDLVLPANVFKPIVADGK